MPNRQSKELTAINARCGLAELLRGRNRKKTEGFRVLGPQSVTGHKKPGPAGLVRNIDALIGKEGQS